MIHSARVRSFLAFFLCLVVLSASFCVSASAYADSVIGYHFDVPEYNYKLDVERFNFSYIGSSYNVSARPAIYGDSELTDSYLWVINTYTDGDHKPVVGEYNPSSVTLQSEYFDFFNKLAPGDTLKYDFSLFCPSAISTFLPDFFYVDIGFMSGDGNVTIKTVYTLTRQQLLDSVFENGDTSKPKFSKFTANITLPDNSVAMSVMYRFGTNSDHNSDSAIGIQDSYLYLSGETLNRYIVNGKLDEVIGNDDSEDSASGIKGVILWIKNLPEKISLKLKEVFVPSEDSITSFKTKMQALLSSRLGVLWEIPDFIVTTFKSIIAFKPSETHKIDFPAFKYSMSKTGEFSQGTTADGYNFDFWSKQTITFDFLDDYPYSVLYTGYKMSVTCILLSALIALAVRKGNEILGGG